MPGAVVGVVVCMVIFGCVVGNCVARGPGVVEGAVVWNVTFGCEVSDCVGTFPGGELSGAPTAISHR